MTDKALIQLKKLIKQALVEYFEESGVNEILLTLYKEATSTTKQKSSSKPSTVENLIKKNADALKTNISAPSRIQRLKQQSNNNQLQFSFNEKTPMLNALALATQYETSDDDTPVNVSTNALINENFDSVTMGVSVLDSNMPDFLRKGINKLART